MPLFSDYEIVKQYKYKYYKYKYTFYSLILKPGRPGILMVPERPVLLLSMIRLSIGLLRQWTALSFCLCLCLIGCHMTYSLDWLITYDSAYQSTQSSRNRFSSYSPVTRKKIRYKSLRPDSKPGPQHDKRAC